MSAPEEGSTASSVDPDAITNPVFKGFMFNSSCLVLIALVAWATDTFYSAGISVCVNFAVFLLHALPQSSEKFFDATGTLTYLTLIVSGVLLSPASPFYGEGARYGLRQMVLSCMVCVWAIRLGSYLLARICKDGKDVRFDKLKGCWILWMGVWSYQAVWCFFVALPVLVVLSNLPCTLTPWTPGPADIVGWAIWLIGFSCEVVSDRQKDAFRRDPANKGRFITCGLWSRSRHPNYFGEITLWVGICISGTTCFAQEWRQLLAWLSPLTTFILLMFISGVPMLEKTGEERWGTEPAYQHYMANTPCLIPRLTTPPPFQPEESIPE